MRLNDKQSLITSAIVVFGFSISGIIGLLDNYMIIGAISLLFIIVVANLFTSNNFFDKDEEIPDITDTSEVTLKQDDTL